ncbi:unnamed protein product, partial [Rotaria socialis]
VVHQIDQLVDQPHPLTLHHVHLPN